MDLESFAAQSLRACSDKECHYDLLRWVLEQPGLVKRTGTWCEFGVGAGGSLKRIATQRGAATLWGFDSFRGLPEDWNERHRKGHFANECCTVFEDGVNLVIGWYADTLPSFSPSAPITFAHIDCDLYSSTRCVFGHLAEHFADSAIIVFDEIFAQPYDNGEMKALYQLHASGSIALEWLGKHEEQGAIRIYNEATS